MCSTVFYNQTQVRLRSTNTLPLFGELMWFGIMIMISILNKKSRAVFFKMLFMVIKSILFVQVILLGLWPPLGHTLLSTVNFAASFPATGVHALARDARIRTTVPFLLGDEFWSHPSSQDARFIKATVWVAGPQSVVDGSCFSCLEGEALLSTSVFTGIPEAWLTVSPAC